MYVCVLRQVWSLKEKYNFAFKNHIPVFSFGFMGLLPSLLDIDLGSSTLFLWWFSLPGSST